MMVIPVLFVCAQPGDTTIIQTFSPDVQNNPNTAYDSPGRRWFEFPASDNGIEYQKILMYYNLRCFSQGTAGGLGFPCGEWDYLTYTYLYQHTGIMDSSQSIHPHYKINNADFDQTSLTSQPIFNYYQTLLDSVVIDSETNVQSTQLGIEDVEISALFGDEVSQRRHFIYHADDLIAAGLQSGVQIGKLSFHFPNGNFQIDQFKIEFALVSATITNLNAPSIVFEEIFEYPVFTSATGWHEFSLADDFIWDGSSSIVLRLSNRNTNSEPAALWSMEETPTITSLDFSASDRFIKFDWQDEVKVPAEVFADVSDQITISFWQYGDPASQPQDGTIFEGVNALNQRVLNVHLPWSNGRVYWDAGYTDGYDRIDKLAQTINFEGKWNHWCFTKNTNTGSMKIYLNGVLWHSGTNMDNPMNGITRFSIGGATSWSNFYNGSMDEFAVFNTELDAATIQAWMMRDMTSEHPAWSNLQVYYQFNEANGEMILDASGHEHHAWMHGNADRKYYIPEDLFRNGVESNQRPVVKFITGDFVTHQTSQLVTTSVQIPPVSIVEFDIENYQPVAIDVQYSFVAQDYYYYDVEGEVINTVFEPAEFIINNDDMTYWQAPFEVVNRYELNRFITPYGIQLTLGSDGWTWITDVTDWAPLLRDSVELESGNWQELLDLKFVFIEGTPARDVKRVERVWDRNVNIADFDNQITAVNLQKESGEAGWKLVTTNTGHGFGFDNNNCGEFCNNIQSVKVNGTQQWSWDIMQECATNPLYPQGGTWIYDRAGWCPGMNSETKEFELTPFVSGDNEFSVDYDVQYDPYGNYVFFGTLIGYGAPNHQHDPEIEMITAPSNWKIYSRWNPVCDNPSFILRNKGASPLTDLNIYFGVEGGEMETLHWTGNLGFMESEEIILNYSDPILWQGDDSELMTFHVNLGMSTDGVDENTSNNNASSNFYRPPVYAYPDLDDNRLIIQLKTNLAFNETSYALYDINDNVVFSRNNFDLANTTYRDTIQLNSGCYKFHVLDSGEDGLQFFANNDGNGNCKFDRIAGFDFINFETDFGKEFVHHFYWNTNLVTVDELPKQTIGVKAFPNPTIDHCVFQLQGFDRDVNISLYNSVGVLVKTEKVKRRSNADQIDFSMGELSSGLYHAYISDGKSATSLKLMRE